MTARKRQVYEDPMVEIWNLRVRVAELEGDFDELRKRFEFLAYPWDRPENREDDTRVCGSD